LDALVTHSRNIGDAATEQNLLNLPSVTENAQAALTAYDQSATLQPLNKRVALSRAWLRHWLNTPGQESARDLALLAGVSQSDVLFQVGQISQRMANTDVQIRSWRRSLMISSHWAPRIWDEMTLTDPEEEVLKVFPDQLESLLAVMNLPNDMSVRRQIARRCEAIISNTPDVPPVMIARLHAAEGKLQAAVDGYLRAIRKSPRDIELRLEASVVIENSGQIVKAREIVATAYGLAPRDPKVKARLEQLLARERETR
jgi:tetratricopeptide (TPR) repeat protein